MESVCGGIYLLLGLQKESLEETFENTEVQEIITVNSQITTNRINSCKQWGTIKSEYILLQCFSFLFTNHQLYFVIKYVSARWEPFTSNLIKRLHQSKTFPPQLWFLLSFGVLIMME